jgi:two-component system phosphate regulon sensor histidine kinase PhoR
MRKVLNFRQKVVLSQFFLFIAFMACAFPFIGRSVRHIVFDIARVNTCLLIEALQEAPSQEEMIQTLQNVDNSIFYGTALFNEHGDILYDSAIGAFVDEKNGSFYLSMREDVLQALHRDVVYAVSDLNAMNAKAAYVLIAFDAHGQTYVLRASFAYALVEDFSQEFKLWYLLFCSVALIFFGGLTWLVFHRVSSPIHQIITAIKPYQLGKTESIPLISLSKTINPEDDFFKLAKTLNSLSDRICLQIQSITEEKNEKEAILESLGEGVIAVDGQMIVRYINAVGSKMLGLSKRHLIGKPLAAASAKHMASLVQKCQQLLSDCRQRGVPLTDSISVGENKKIYLDLIAAPKMHNHGAILVLQDKSSHYRVLEMGKDFVANASHELRTPITIIKGFAETLQDMPTLPREMVIEITEKIVRNCQRMDNLVKNLLMLADLDNLPSSRFQECDLNLLIENCRQVVLAVYETAQIEIIREKEEVGVFADPDILELAIINLLDNACKYSPPPAQITVRIDEKEGEAIIVISDRGMGIPEQDLEKIFDRFYTVDKAHSRRLGGAGLGLSIVKTIVEKHNGTIGVVSKLGKGTTFTLTLPATQFP